MKEQDYFTSIDLFSGPGGLCTGFKWAGIKPLIAVEWSYWTVQTYAASHNADIFVLEDYLNGAMEAPEKFFVASDRTLLIYGDINKVTDELVGRILRERFNRSSVDIVTGGAPCESFSMAGDRKQNDDRNLLYKNILRIARASRAKMFMFENVKGLLSKKHRGRVGLMYKKLCEDFESKKSGLPYYTLVSKDKDTVLLKASDYGVPQARERLFLVGISHEYAGAKFHYPKKTHGLNRDYSYLTVGNAICDLPKVKAGEENPSYTFNTSEIKSPEQRLFLELMRGDTDLAPADLEFDHNTITSHKAPGHTSKMKERIKLILQGESMKTAYERLMSEGKEDLVTAYFPKKIYGARNRRLKPNEPSFTVTSHCLDEMLHPYEDRGLTPREAARLQSFPDWYCFKGHYVKFHSDPEQDQYEQIGDAIPPLLAYALGKEIHSTLKQIKEGEECEQQQP